MVKNAGARVFHGIMVVTCAVLCLVAIVSFSSFATIHDKIRKKNEPWHPHQCILFTSDGKHSDTVDLSTGRSCVLAIWGEVFVALLSLLLGIVFIVKAAIGVNARSCFSVVELIVIVVTGLLDFALAVMISIGLDITCDAFDESRSSCSNAALDVGSTSIKFYHNISTSEATAWIGTGILTVMTVVHFVLLFLYIRHHRQGGYEYSHLETDATNQEDSKPEAV